MSTLRSRGRALPWTGLVVVVGGAALAGLPPFGTCLAKGMIEEAAKGAGTPWVTPLFVLAGALTGGAVLEAAAIHEGPLGDYVAWLVAGAAATGWAFAWAIR